MEDYVRSIHGASYTRLFNVDLLTMVREFATDFIPPQMAGQPGRCTFQPTIGNPPDAALFNRRLHIARLVEKRDERRDGFVQVVKKAMETRLGSSSDEVLNVLAKQGITRSLTKEALEVASSHGAFTIFAVVDALTRISGKLANAGERSVVDQKASALLSLAK